MSFTPKKSPIEAKRGTVVASGPVVHDLSKPLPPLELPAELKATLGVPASKAPAPAAPKGPEKSYTVVLSESEIRTAVDALSDLAHELQHGESAQASGLAERLFGLLHPPPGEVTERLVLELMTAREDGSGAALVFHPYEAEPTRKVYLNTTIEGARAMAPWLLGDPLEVTYKGRDLLAWKEPPKEPAP